MRQIVLDTETTGLDPLQGHRVIEIGCVEIENRRLTGRHYHCYLNPDREIDDGAVQVHGITSQFLADKPRFKQVAAEFLDFVRGAELVIHNAPFDLGFLNHELLDAEILADVYLLMTGGQTILQLQNEEDTQQEGEGTHRERDLSRGPLLVTQPSHADMLAHEQFLDRINKQSNNACVWSAAQTIE